MSSPTVAQQIDAMEKMPFAEQMKFNTGIGGTMIKNEAIFEKVRFIRRCYGLLIAFLLLSTLISVPFINHSNETMLTIGNHHWMLILAVVALFLQMSFHLTVLVMLKKDMNVLFRGYLVIMNKPATGCIWAAVYVSSFTFIVDAALTAWGQQNLCHVYVYTLVGVMGLMVYTHAIKNPDFKQMYAYCVPVYAALLIWVTMALFRSEVHQLPLFVSVLLGWMVVYETQLIFGTKVERGRKYPYQVGMYIMAAYEIYFDMFINFYLGGLNLFKTGDLDDPTVFEQA